MRLLNTTTLKLREPSSEKVPYAILSHCWEDEEVLFQDIQGPDPSAKKGFKKLANCCARAKSRGYEWVWIDTCCIDKTSSSELSEAINSMYRWYAESDICYAFLSDVSLSNTKISGIALGYVVDQLHNELNRLRYNLFGRKRMYRDRWKDKYGPDPDFAHQFSSSRWFTRGWTLQELLAPRKVEFYNSHWQFVGTKASLVEQLVFITRIDEQSLLGCGSILDVPVARKLSWAASRETTRVEDIAYCLMGLFGVNMPLLYGEGKKAFMRLQGEIIQQTNDHTILLLSNRPPDSIRYKGLPSILEYSPAECLRTSLFLLPRAKVWDMNLISGQFPDNRVHNPHRFGHEVKIDWDQVKSVIRRSDFDNDEAIAPLTMTPQGLRACLLTSKVAFDKWACWTGCTYQDRDSNQLYWVFMCLTPENDELRCSVVGKSGPGICLIGVKYSMLWDDKYWHLRWTEVYLNTRLDIIGPNAFNSNGESRLGIHLHRSPTQDNYPQVIDFASQTSRIESQDGHTLWLSMPNAVFQGTPGAGFRPEVIVSLHVPPSPRLYYFVLGVMWVDHWCCIPWRCGSYMRNKDLKALIWEENSTVAPERDEGGLHQVKYDVKERLKDVVIPSDDLTVQISDNEFLSLSFVQKNIEDVVLHVRVEEANMLDTD